MKDPFCKSMQSHLEMLQTQASYQLVQTLHSLDDDCNGGENVHYMELMFAISLYDWHYLFSFLAESALQPHKHRT